MVRRHVKADLAKCKASHARSAEAEQARAIAKAKSDQLAKESTCVHEIRAPENRAAAVRYIDRYRIAHRSACNLPVPVTIPAHLLKRPPMPSFCSLRRRHPRLHRRGTYALDAWEWIGGLGREAGSGASEQASLAFAPAAPQA